MKVALWFVSGVVVGVVLYAIVHTCPQMSDKERRSLLYEQERAWDIVYELRSRIDAMPSTEGALRDSLTEARAAYVELAESCYRKSREAR